jgi:hypothetical protein
MYSWAISHPVLLRWLLQHGANPNIKTRRQVGSCSTITSPMSYAAILGLPDAIETLFEFGAELDTEAMFFAIGVGGSLHPFPLPSTA